MAFFFLSILQYTPPPKDWRFRTHNLKVPSFGESLKIPVCGHCAVVCGDFEIFHKVPLCVVPVLWCVRTWSFQSSPSCVGSVLWRVKTLSFQSSPRCGLCVVVCEDFEVQSLYVCGPCVVVLPGFVPVLERLIFQKVLIEISPLYWRDCFLGSKSL